MTKRFQRIAGCLATGAVLVGTAAAQTIIQPTAPRGIAPIGVGATTSELLFSQPFGSIAPQPRGIYSVTNISAAGPVRTATLAQTISLPTTMDAENYFYISPGLGGFAAGSVYATNPTSLSSDAVYKDGILFINAIPDSNPGHAGITFDTVGTFRNAMIVTTSSGIFGFSSTGFLLFSYPAPSGFLLESATVAPLTNLACPGCLYLTAESVEASLGQPNPPNGAIYVIKPLLVGGPAPQLVATTPGVEPENILFVTPQVCTLSGTNFSYFVSAYAAGPQINSLNSTSGALLAYTQTEVGAAVGRALVVMEGTVSEPGRIYSFDPATNTFSLFSTPVPNPPTNPSAYQLEGASLITCP